eukprot:COSAG05_NODE_65_length_22456_cov_17.448540_2_plen_125_part_00
MTRLRSLSGSEPWRAPEGHAHKGRKGMAGLRHVRLCPLGCCSVRLEQQYERKPTVWRGEGGRAVNRVKKGEACFIMMLSRRIQTAQHACSKEVVLLLLLSLLGCGRVGHDQRERTACSNAKCRA